MHNLFRSIVLVIGVFASLPPQFFAQAPSPTDSNSRQQADKNQKDVVDWLKQNAIPVKTVEAGNGFADLQPLKKVFRDVQFVGLGEATHGSRDFFQFKHRLLEFLVKEMGFRVFAIEASHAACENINDYVMGKNVDGGAALDSQQFWVWNTEEVRAMLDWMREYNTGVPAEKRVKFVGFDIQHNEMGKTKLLEYLRRVAPPERVSEAEELFKVNLDDYNAALDTQEKVKQAEGKLLEFQTKYYDLFMFMELTAPMIISLSSQAEYEQMRETARVLAQYAESYRYSDYRNVMLRDIYMADNIRRIASREPAGTRFVIWAHNLHIAEGGTGEGRLTSGYILRKLYGPKYYALGFSFNQGAFQAREDRPENGTNKMLRSFAVQPAPFDSIDWYLAQTGVKTFLTDFRTVRKNAAANGWLTETRKMRSVGSVYDVSWEQKRDFRQIAPGKEFDGLFFIDTVKRARPNPSVKNVARGQ